MSLAQILFVCSRNFGSGKDALEGDDDDFAGDAEDRLTGLFAGDGILAVSINDRRFAQEIRDYYIINLNIVPGSRLVEIRIGSD